MVSIYQVKPAFQRLLRPFVGGLAARGVTANQVTLGALALALWAPRRYDGPMGKSDRAAAFGLIALLLGIGVPPAPWLGPALWLILALAAWTIVRRARAALAATGTTA